jgi:hypothetical protein
VVRRGEVALVAASVLGLGVAVALAPGTGAGGGDEEPLSIRSAAPGGAKGLAQVLRRLGVAVEAWRHSLFDYASDTVPRGRDRVLALLAVGSPTPEEVAAVRHYAARGGRVFAAGETGFEACLGYAVRPVPWRSGGGRLAVKAPDPSWRLPPAEAVLAAVSGRERLEEPGGGGTACAPLTPVRRDTLLASRDGRPVALRLRFGGGGEAVLLADPGYLRNRALKETDAGLVVVPWIADGRTRRVTVDEYHHGGEAKGSVAALLGATWRWLAAHPSGWAVLQLVAVLLVGLGVSAVRFGPARAGTEHRRRSPLEHVHALGAGLERAGGTDIAVGLLVAGLRRRLGARGTAPAGADDAWLAALERALPGAAAPAPAPAPGRSAVRRLRDIVAQRGGGAERALAAAHAVEDVWEALRPLRTQPPS